MPAQTNNKYDIAVLGATGYVGRRLLAQLAELARKNKFRLLATVRSEDKQKKLSRLHPSITINLMNVNNSKQVHEIVGQAYLVINCIGPFDLYGENVVQACANLGVHYLDITGEILFGRRMIERYDGIAKENKATIVPFAGFDSIPSDIGTFLIAKEMAGTGRKVKSIDVIFKMKGGLNGGTARTALDSGKKIKLLEQKNNYFLVPEKNMVLNENLEKPRHITHINKWVAPFFMEPINNKVVYRSVALGNPSWNYFSENFSYRESTFVPQGFLGAMAVSQSLTLSRKVFKSAVGRQVANFFLPQSGQGPTEEQMRDGFFDAMIIATSTEGDVLVRHMRSQGDPGNVSTVKLLMSCVRTLFSDGYNPKFGVTTPAIAFGEQILPHLKKSEVTWE